MTNINSAFYNYDETVEKSKTSYSGLLGLAINGNRIVNHPTRAGYVYVRLRDNLSEVVQAFNDKVSPVYDFPVLIQRKGNRWYVLGRDDLRYETWGTSAPYLPRHGDQHSFNRDGGGGGDVVWTYPDQFMPLLVYPSGTYGASNLLVAPYVLQKSDKFIYVGNTGTANIARYKPTTSSAIMGLVYLDRDTGNPGFLINSGTPFSGAITGTNAVVPYLPYPSATQEPLYAFRLVSGTTSLTWANLYNVRQFIGGSTSTGTSTSNHEALSGLLGGSANNHYHLTPSQVIGLVSGTSTTLHQHSGTSPAGSTNAVQINNGGVFGADDEFEYTLGGQIVSLGKDAGAEASAVWSWQTGGVAFHNIASWGTGNYSSMRGILARGTKASPTAAQADDIGMRFRGSAYDGTGLVLSSATGAEIRFVANENQSATNHGMRAEIWTTPNASTTEAKTLVIGEGGIASNVTANKTLTLTATDNYTLTVPATGQALVAAVGATAVGRIPYYSTTTGIVTSTANFTFGTNLTLLNGAAFVASYSANSLFNAFTLQNLNTGTSAGIRAAITTDKGILYFEGFSAAYTVANWAGKSGLLAASTLNGLLLASPATIQFDSSNTAVSGFIFNPTDGSFIGNEAGNANGDFRYESDTEANMIFLDASADLLYLGGNTAGTSTTIAKGGALTSAAAILSAGATGGIGYTTGAGGTVTQATNKATGVTLNKVTGLITMNNAALAADTTVTFTLTSSAIAATDTVILNHASAGTAGSYTLNAQVAAGSATINVRNVTAGSLSEAIVIRYTVIKSISA